MNPITIKHIGTNVYIISIHFFVVKINLHVYLCMCEFSVAKPIRWTDVRINTNADDDRTSAYWDDDVFMNSIGYTNASNLWDITVLPRNAITYDPRVTAYRHACLNKCYIQPCSDKELQENCCQCIHIKRVSWPLAHLYLLAVTRIWRSSEHHWTDTCYNGFYMYLCRYINEILVVWTWRWQWIISNVRLYKSKSRIQQQI